MKISRQVLRFGAVSGLIWSIFPAALRQVRSLNEAATYVLAGVLVGILTSLILASALKRRGRAAAIFLGALSLPLAAFMFGVLVSVIQWLVREATGTAVGFAAYGRNPVFVGAEFSVYASISIFAPVLFLLAVGTTLLLRRFVGQGLDSELMDHF